ncbi:uncharacterized protein N7498_000723 [Penicillium cinerascens]|uniref:Uncharacterized protein n=1 Tax=Penicillium cinerascens TaxID=70096 RepID=A0A9W9NEV3_9EURO|nr:uncharacterized protein N7498_000723 [Penicillium cinerascens]KAJ5218624.1 hypothetical protein N7498_000723 [Penicillium cinerascens]
MQFKLSTLVALLAASPALAASKGATVAAGIYKVTTKVLDVRKVAESIELTTYPSKASLFFSDYRGLLDLKNEQVQSSPDGIEPSSEPEVCNAFISYSEVEKNFLATIIDKEAIFKSFASALPVLEMLRSDSSISDTYYSNVLGLVPSCQADIMKNGK